MRFPRFVEGVIAVQVVAIKYVNLDVIVLQDVCAMSCSDDVGLHVRTYGLLRLQLLHLFHCVS